MDETRWDRLQWLFHEALERPPEARREWLAAECAADPALLAEALAMLAEDARADSLLSRDLAQVAHDLLAEGAPEGLESLRFGPYRLVRLLGEGGMGVVHLGCRDDLGSLAAIKILRDAWLSPARRERFSAEQRLLASLNHPAIARLYDADALPDGTPWFAMEYVEGLPITAYCAERRAPLAERLRLVRAVCEAVDHAHRNLIVHRDLKPSNILVRADGSVKLLDFGISKSLAEIDGPDDRTRTEMRALTPAYAAPEQLRGEPVATTTDVHALGVLLYELLTGRLPFPATGRTPGELERLITEDEPPPPSVAARDGSGPPVDRRAWGDLDVLCLTALRKEPARRYRTVEALIRDLDHFRAGDPLEARPDSAGYRIDKFMRRHRRPLAAAAFGLAVVTGLTLYYAVRLTGARDEARAEAERTRRIQAFMLNLFQGGDESAGPADTLRVVTLIERGEQEARSLDADPGTQAELYEALGTISQGLGRLARADTLLSRSLALRQTRRGANQAEVARSVTALALLRGAEARFDEADSLGRLGLALARRHAPTGDPAVARAAVALGQILELRGEYEQAIPILAEAVRLQARPGVPVADRTSGLTELANVHFYLGNYAASDSLNRLVLDIDRARYGPRHPHVADDLINLGAIRFEASNYASAESSYGEALGILRGWYGRDHPETASAMTMLGRALVAGGKDDSAAVVLDEALLVQERVYGPQHPRVASALNELGNLYLRRKLLDQAEGAFRRMIDTYRAVHGDRHYLLGIARGNLASVYMERQQFSEAEALYREALRIYLLSLPGHHLNVGIGRLKLGRSLLRQQRFAAAERETRAGYEILIPQVEPTSGWLRNARTDLVAEYEALGRTAEADSFRAGAAPTAPASR